MYYIGYVPEPPGGTRGAARVAMKWEICNVPVARSVASVTCWLSLLDHAMTFKIPSPGNDNQNKEGLRKMSCTAGHATVPVLDSELFPCNTGYSGRNCCLEIVGPMALVLLPSTRRSSCASLRCYQQSQ